MVMQTGQLLVQLTRRIAVATGHGARAVGEIFREGAARIRAAADALTRADGRYATRVLEDSDIPAGEHFLGWDDRGNQWAFTADHVRSRLLRNYDGKPIGVQYPSKLGDSTTGKGWSRAKYRHTDFEYFIDDDVESSRMSFKRRSPLREPPWVRISSDYQHSSPRARTNPVYVDVHANQSAFLVRIKTGRFSSRAVDFRGADFARLNAANIHFNRALSENRDANALTLVACEAAAGFHIMTYASKEFANYIHNEAGVKKDVFAATGTVGTPPTIWPNFLRSSELGVSLPGGIDSTQPAWIRHTVQGQDIPIWARNTPPEGRTASDDYF
ncbi:hypothetical protein [Nocardia sp. NPDC051463]|uniref:hypothetical protein n=1 Tax=Nocardia sp. NPDC051463 TaxID=3154845 RepID=UPI003429B063